MEAFIYPDNQETFNQQLKQYVANVESTLGLECQSALKKLKNYLYNVFCSSENKCTFCISYPNIYYIVFIVLEQEDHKHLILARKVYEHVRKQFFKNPYAIPSSDTEQYKVLNKLLLKFYESVTLRTEHDDELNENDQTFLAILMEDLNKLNNYKNYFPPIDVSSPLSANSFVDHFNEHLKYFAQFKATYQDEENQKRLFEQLHHYMQLRIHDAEKFLCVEEKIYVISNIHVYALLQKLSRIYIQIKYARSLKNICDVVIRGLEKNENHYFVGNALFFNGTRLYAIELLQAQDYVDHGIELDKDTIESDKAASENNLKNLMDLYQRWRSTISIHDKDCLNHGAYGKVFKGRFFDKNLQCEKEVAVKHISLQDESDAWREINILTQLQHPYIVPFLGYCYSSQKGSEENKLFYLAFELMKANLIEIWSVENNILYEIWLSWLQQITSAVYYLHNEKNIVHSDIKPDNILINFKGEAVLADFGGSYVAPTAPVTRVFTKRYASPELLKSGLPSFRSDMFALGATFFVVAAKKNFKQVTEGRTTNQRNPIPNSVPSHITKVIKGCWEEEESRYTAETVMQHLYFQGPREMPQPAKSRKRQRDCAL